MTGLQTSARFGSASGPGIATRYDGFGRVSSTTTTMDGTARTLSYTWREDGARSRIDSNFGYGSYATYDAGGAVLSLSDGSGSEARFGYDAAGRRQSLDQGPGGATSWTSYGYDAVGRLQTLGHDLAGAAFDQSYTLAYNPASQIVTKTASNDGYRSNTAYDVNRLYVANGLNQYTQVGPAGAQATLGYDANGNLIATPDGNGGTLAYLYDAENRLVSATRTLNGTATTTALSYDPNGRLWQVSGPSGTTRFTYDGDRLIWEMDGAGAFLRAYAHGPGPDEPLMWYENVGGFTRHHLHADHQGSIVAAVDDSGTTTGLAGYDEWGIPNSSALTNVGRLGYTGQAWIPELGLWYYKARFYSPTLGRFLQTDPVGYKDQVNLYAYVGNDPVDGRDPTGLYECAKGTDCTKFEAYRQRLIVALDKFEKGSKDYNRINASLTRIGDPSTKGITVVEGGLNVKYPGSAANISADGSGVLTLYTKTLEQSASDTHTDATDYGAAVIGHEADPVHSGGFTTREGRLNAEISGYTTQDAVNRALHLRLDPSYDLFQPDREKRIRDAAERSVTASCVNGGGAC